MTTTATPTIGMPAVLGGTRSVRTAIPAWPICTAADEARILAVIRGGHWSWLGPQEKGFCEAFRRFIGSSYCLALANGTVTLQCALQAVGVEPGDEVIVPALTWVATAQAALDIGANVVLVDIDPETLCLDPAAVRAAITPATKAIVPVHLYGCMCDMDALGEMAREHGLKIVEDVAHQHGSRWRDIGAGAIGDAGSFSFQQSKVLTSGEGGAVTCSDPDVYATVFALKQVGWAPEDVRADPYGDAGLTQAGRYGHNYRITEMQAALLRGGLERLPEQTQRREDNAAYLRAGLERIGGPLRVARRDPRVTVQAYYAVTLYFDAETAAGLARDAYAGALAAEGIRVGGTYPPVYRCRLLNLYDRTSPVPYRDPATVQDYAHLRLPHTEKAVNETALLLTHQHLLGDRAHMDEILAGIDKVNHALAPVRRHWEARTATVKKGGAS